MVGRHAGNVVVSAPWALNPADYGCPFANGVTWRRVMALAIARPSTAARPDTLLHTSAIQADDARTDAQAPIQETSGDDGTRVDGPRRDRDQERMTRLAAA